MLDMNMRLISMLGVITIVVLAGLVVDYLKIVRGPARPGLCIAVFGLVMGALLTLSAVLPGNDVFGQVFSEGRMQGKVIALTFDDGPYPPYTDEILDILQEYQVPATFFVIGQNAVKHPDEVKRIVKEGHQIGNHTFHHLDLLKLDSKMIATEVDRTSQAILGITGQTPQVVRPPHGFRDPVVMEIMKQRKLKVVEWSVMSRDWTNPGVDTIVERTVAQAKTGAVILLHDGDGVAAEASRAQTVEAVRRIIPLLQKQGYKFVTVQDILEKTGEKKQ